METALKKIEQLIELDPQAKSWQGAVLYLICEGHIILIKRSQTMPSHKGQVAFIGGSKNQNENEPLACAMREFEEESALDAKKLKFLTLLPSVLTSRNKAIIPVLATCDMKMEDFIQSAHSNGEWDEIFSVPLSIVCDKSLWRSGLFIKHGQRIRMRYISITNDRLGASSVKMPQSKLLWGATGLMVWRTLNFVENLIDS